MPANPSHSVTLSRQTLGNTAARALAFLQVVGADPRIHAALAGVGFTDKDVERGWALLRNVFGASKPGAVTPYNPVASAIDQLEAWNGPGFLRARAALRHLHPEQESFVFDGLAVGHGAEAVLSVATFLDRCMQLESGKDRKPTHKADLAALATLEKRGVTKSERKRLGEMVAIVETQAAPLPEIEPTPVAERDARILELRGWLLDWSDTARAVIKRRDQLIRLGIGKRRSKKSAPIAPIAAPAAQPAAPASPAKPASPFVIASTMADDEPGPESTGPGASFPRAA